MQPSLSSLTLEPSRECLKRDQLTLIRTALGYSGRSPLAYFTNLSSLTLIPPSPSRASWAVICEMLGDVQSPALRRLRFEDVLYHGSQPGSQIHVNASGPDYACFCMLPDFGLAALDAVLARDVFKHQAQVEFTLQRIAEFDEGQRVRRNVLPEPGHPALEHGDLLAQTQDVLPQLCARGVVVFEGSW